MHLLVFARSVATKQSSKLADFGNLGLLRFARKDGSVHIYSCFLLNETAPFLLQLNENIPTCCGVLHLLIQSCEDLVYTLPLITAVVSIR